MQRSVRTWARFGACAVVASVVLGGILLGSHSAAAATWTDSSEADFLGGTLTDVTATPAGDLVLSRGGVPMFAKQDVVLDVGPPGAVDDVRAYNPFVLREADGTFKVWYTAYDGSRFRMAFADSPDGLTWTKRGVVINVLTAPWNFDSVSSMSVIKEGATYHMWFAAGYWTGSPCPIGYYSEAYYATSSDGISWSIAGRILALGAPGAWDACFITTPWVVFDGSLYRLYYNGGDGSTQGVGIATSSAKTGFTRYAGNPVVAAGLPGAWDDYYIAAESVTMGPTWTMYFAAHDGTNARLGLGFSADGFAWTKFPGNPWMDLGPASWDSVGIASAMPVSDPGGERLYYSGYDGTYIRTGYALLSYPYLATGSYVSRAFDSGGAGTTWQTVAWSATTPAGTSVSPYARSGDTPAPDPTWTSWAVIAGPSSGTPLTLPRHRYAQYRADLATTDTNVTPALHEVTITYEPNGAPGATSLAPAGGVWLRVPTPTLAWIPSDPEGDAQSAFEAQLSPDPSFANLLSSGVRASSVPNWQPPPLGDGVWSWRVRVRDVYGAWGGWSTESFGIDVTPPATQSALGGTPGSGGWYRGPVMVTLTATDATSGVASTSYRLDEGLWQTYASPFSVAEDGVHDLEFSSTDVAGVVEATQSASFGIDTTPPVTTADPTGRLGDGGTYTAPVAVVLTAADATSGPADTEYRLDGGAWQAYAGPFLVPGDGSHTVDYRSTDNAGLVEADRSIAFDVDTVPPETMASLSGAPGVAGFFTGPVTVSLAATDATSGVAGTEYRIDGGVWQPYAGPFVVAADGVHVVEFRSTDNAGLEEPVQVARFSVDTGILSPTGPLGPWLLVLLIAIAAAVLLFVLGLILGKRKREEVPGPESPPVAPGQ